MKEQRILEAKREKYNEIEDSRRKEIFADQDQKVENQYVPPVASCLAHTVHLT
jgi:hypothetical protein